MKNDFDRKDNTNLNSKIIHIPIIKNYFSTIELNSKATW